MVSFVRLPKSMDDIIGTPYRVCALKPFSFGLSRFRRWIQVEGRFLTPSTVLLETEDGRKFKLLSTSLRNRHWIDLHLFNYEVASKLKFVPRVMWSDACHLLVEFIEGALPAIEGDDFAIKLGQCLAQVHHVDANELSMDVVLQNIERDLQTIVRAQAISNAAASRLRDRLADCLPSRVRTSLTYVDLQRSNFCIAESGELIFLDLGSFQRGRFTDDSLFGHKLVRPTLRHSLNLDLLKESYLDSGGVTQLFEWGKYLEVLDDIRKAALCVRRLHGSAMFQRGRIKMYRQLIADRAVRLNAFVGS